MGQAVSGKAAAARYPSLLAVPSTAGTGSETTVAAVISFKERGGPCRAGKAQGARHSDAERRNSSSAPASLPDSPNTG